MVPLVHFCYSLGFTKELETRITDFTYLLTLKTMNTHQLYVDFSSMFCLRKLKVGDDLLCYMLDLLVSCIRILRDYVPCRLKGLIIVKHYFFQTFTFGLS